MWYILRNRRLFVCIPYRWGEGPHVRPCLAPSDSRPGCGRALGCRCHLRCQARQVARPTLNVPIEFPGCAWNKPMPKHLPLEPYHKYWLFRRYRISSGEGGKSAYRIHDTNAAWPWNGSLTFWLKTLKFLLVLLNCLWNSYTLLKESEGMSL